MIIAPVFADSLWAAWKDLSFMKSRPRGAKRVTPFMPMRLAKMTEGVMHHYPDDHYYAVDNMWTHAPAADLVAGVKRIAETLPPAPSHMLWMNWAPKAPRADMAYSVEDNIYVALYGIWKDAENDAGASTWAREPHEGAGADFHRHPARRRESRRTACPLPRGLQSRPARSPPRRARSVRAFSSLHEERSGQRMMRSRPVAGRHLGWSEADLASKPYADFLNPKLSPLPDHIRDALDRGPVAEPRLPPVQAAAQSLFGAAPVLEDGFALTADGAMHVAARTDMPGVTPEMIDWWFGWHSDSPERYKLWHPNAHVYAAWSAPPPAGTRGRARYVGQTSIVDEYIGSNLIRAAIQFVQPRLLGLADASLDDPQQATIVCARTGLGDFPIDVGYLAHHVRRTPTGSEMRSRFWIGGPYAAGRGSTLGAVMARGARLVMRPSEADARALLVHCAEEMQHLASFLPALFAKFRSQD